MQTTLMELKPLLSADTHDQTFSDVMNTVTENMHAVSASVSEVLNSAVDSISVNSIHINNSFKSDEAPDLKMKLEFAENDVLGRKHSTGCFLQR